MTIDKQDGPYEVVRSPEVTRRLTLLWDPPEPKTRGRRATLTREDVVAAAVALADEGGLDALSMRRVASALNVGAMSLYTYVPGRTELIDLMIDRVYAEMDLPRAGTQWRPALAQYAREHWTLYQRHPWILQTNMWRAPLAPHVLDAQEAGLRTLIDAGPTERQVVEILGVVDNFVQGQARTVIAEDREKESTGLDSDAYWTSMSSFWVDFFDVERFPTMTRIWNAGAFDEPQGTFESSLERLLDSIELTVERARAGS
ncbi:TetR/AcrR family transcriptional regulator [Rhodococcus artemisiae]|uniref:TetR/AcrR family transcriptional regulator C-terminal domain-containing protein n=1 Tax=Rhodococcus artemisiae TaxID=714159 RepID=A0ABU7LJC8_9NOCA|nr:TetR/AcrR family transcriptional regulator C-terminal domain-containing protein [Rhodococcus artemisiae]MEE2061357.1 TetR/AcrR family transcriptional regulator C-terminal domain-containing protein [Rhodococcus artemisiae]